MAVKRHALPYSVLEGAKRRIIAAFSNDVPVYLGMSGGKDSIVLADLVYQLIRAGRIDGKLLTVDFIDEEAIFDDVERIVLDWRKKFMLEGVTFRWWCIEVKHFNCFNRLSQDETFICWDSERPDTWVRKMPRFAITDHPMLNRRTDNYQAFLPRVEGDGIVMAGMRVAESLQRLNLFTNKTQSGVLFQPIFDWKDADVWRYIRDQGLDFPVTYMNLYATGRNRREMRISQFFSIDTAKVLVKMDEFEPSLMERVQRREPNAYLAALYWDTEMFRSSGGKGESRDDGDRDYRAMVLERLADPEQSATTEGRRLKRKIRAILIREGSFLTAAEWKTAHSILVGGDPKDRTYRALISTIAKNRENAS